MAATFLTEFDLHLLAEGSHYRTYEKLGAHLAEYDGQSGVRFAVWAPNAREVSVIGDFNGWDCGRHPMTLRREAGVWEGFVPGARPGALYKYGVTSRDRRYRVDKADPYAFFSALRPDTASRVWDLSGYEWRDAEWMAARARAAPLQAPMAVYEVHLGSWMRVPEDGDVLEVR